MSKDLQGQKPDLFDDLPDLEDRVIIQRLALLIIGCIFVGALGFYILQNHIFDTFSKLWQMTNDFLSVAWTAAFWKGMFTWVKTMWVRWIFIEVPKRIFMFSILPYYLIRLMPRRWLRLPRRSLRLTVVWLLQKKDRLQVFTRQHFGHRAGHAIAVVLVTIIFLFFYFVQGAFVLVWFLAFRMPNWIMGPLRFAGNFVWKKMQIGSFAKMMFKFVGRSTNVFRETILLAIARFSPGLARRIRNFGRQKSDEEKRKERLAKTKNAIRKRRHHQHQAANLKLFFAVRGDMNEWRRLVRARLNERARRRLMWRKIIAREQKGIPSLHHVTDHPASYKCCEYFVWENSNRDKSVQVVDSVPTPVAA